MEILLIILLVLWYFSKNERPRNNRKNRNNRNFKPEIHNKPEPEWEWNEATGKWEPKDKSRIVDPVPETETAGDNNLDYEHAYQSRYLFSKNELYQYKALKKIADIKGYIICPKVRLLDIVEPRKGIKKYMTYFYKIQSKHVDFVICDQGMHIKAIVELDDASHDTPERKERDMLVNKILRSVGYKVIHTRYITNDILDTI